MTTTGSRPRDEHSKRCAWLAGLLLCVVAVPVSAQIQEPRIQVSAGGLWAGGTGFGVQSARETRNQAGGDPYALFTTDTSLESAAGFETRLTYWFTRTVGLEAGASWAPAQLVTRITSDAEGAADLSAAVGVTSYAVDAAVLVRLTRLTFANGRVVPFVTGGAGYLRQLYDERAVVETGSRYHAGGGALVWFGPPRRSWLKRAGLRADARWTRQDGGVQLGEAGGFSFGTVAASAVFQF